MTDQAEKLRALIHASSPAVAGGDRELPLIVVSGGRAGVGATTVALNLAAVLADRSERVLLVDAAERRNDLIEPAGMRRDPENTLCEVLAGKCSAREAIVAGPGGIEMLPNRWKPRSSPDFSRRGQQLLLSELESLERDFDFMVVDAGQGFTPWTKRLWQRAKLIVLVTTPDDAAVLDSYAALKLGVADAVHLPVRLLVNQAEVCDAADAHRRMENACQRFLLRSMPALPALPKQFDGGFVGAQAAPRVWEMPNTPFGHAALWLGRAVSDLMNTEDVGSGDEGRFESAFSESHIELRTAC